MKNEEKVLLLLGVSLIILAGIPVSITQEEYTGRVMNASISQPICIELSPQLAAGIFFTNETTIGTQYPITDVQTWNNATENYNGASYGTNYNVTVCSGMTGVFKIYQSVCENLKNDTIGGIINISYVDQPAPNDDGAGVIEGIGVNNATTATGVPDSPSFGPSTIDTYFLIGYNITRSYTGRESVFLRYWLNPYPNNIPSGIYNTTFKIKAVDIAQDPGDGTC